MGPVRPVGVAVASGFGSRRVVRAGRVAGQEHGPRQCRRIRGTLHLLLADEEPRDIRCDGRASDERDRRKHEDDERLSALVWISPGPEDGASQQAGAGQPAHQYVGFSVITVLSESRITGRTPSPLMIDASGETSSRS